MSDGRRTAAVMLGLLMVGAATTGHAQTPLQPPVILVPAARTSEVSRPIALRMPASASILATGNVGLLSTDPDVLFYNPGMLTSARGVVASVQRYGSTATSGAFATVHTAGSLTLALGARVVDWSADASSYSRALVPCPSCLSTVGDVRGESSAFTAGAARSLGPVRLGVAATYARESYGSDFDESALLDVGAVLPFGPGNALGLALAVQHVGAGLDILGPGRPHPWRAVLGVGGRNYPLATFWDITAVSQVAVDADGTLTAGGGAELAWVPLEGVSLAFRVGARHGRDDERPLTGGLGVTLDRWSLDYAVEPRTIGPSAHRLGVRIR